MSNSPVLGSQFSPISWTGDACEQFAAMFQTNERLSVFLNWLLNESGAISDGALDSFSDRMTPCGVIQAYAGSSMPSDYWRPCNGDAVSRTDYAKLFAIIGTTFGPGDGSTTFNLPNSQNRVLVGSGDEYSTGASFGSKTVVLETDQIPKHFHGIGRIIGTVPGTNDAKFEVRTWGLADHGATASFYIPGDAGDLGDGITTPLTSGDLATTLAIPNLESPVTTVAHENMQPSLAIKYIIKVK